ncbi:MAG: ankyrin repeat domain-containing protein [Wolbachia sp.]
MDAVYQAFTEKDTEEIIKIADENLDKINSFEDLKFYLYEVISRGKYSISEQTFSKFKSSEDGKFGDYINDNIYACPASVFAVVQGGNINIIKLLLEYDANCNVQSESGYTALYYACSDYYYEIIELLLEYDANLNV